MRRLRRRRLLFASAAALPSGGPAPAHDPGYYEATGYRHWPGDPSGR